MSGLNPKPIIVNIIPPISSLFHASTNKSVKTNDGIRCIIKPTICCQSDRSGLKASKANRLINRIAIIHIIRGSQCNVFVDSFITVIFKTLYAVFWDFNLKTSQPILISKYKN